MEGWTARRLKAESAMSSGSSGALSPLSFVMSEEVRQRLLAMLVLQKVRDPRTLAACTCVSKEWREEASDEKLWRMFCESQWPYLKSAVGRKLVLQRGYYLFFVRRMNLDLHQAEFAIPLKLGGLHMEDLIFFVHEKANVVVEGRNVAAVPSTVLNASNEDLFRFSAYGAENAESVVVPESRYAQRMWTKAQICNFEVTWSVMEKKTLKSIKLVHTKGGRMVGSSCLFESCLPFPPCFCSVLALLNAALPSACPIAAEVTIQFSECDAGLFRWAGVSMGTLVTHAPHALRYQAKDQALIYLEYHFSMSESCQYNYNTTVVLSLGGGRSSSPSRGGFKKSV
ncbi:hypothetical protein MARPO_0009s0128 [Marchantia polymorpha]|uniref:F-box domain-containing protein n=1 Tax=Marchantia polymorpha TaxID=3197 RepID=A0A2R6XLS4_MARPO|nr:hypothetical protein MARPO_0009s0128 [Marchantia polymorpha]|eukprot:PTQ47031.1 hypothetical protein MARPO_0009s0128 [Marchantia polymorpha]